MAFSADELSVLRRALAHALYPQPLDDEDVRGCLRLADSVDEATREAGRLRAFLLADLARYRDALPGAATGYLELLQDALAAGHVPGAEDLAALRTLRGRPAGAALLEQCQVLAERSLRARLSGRRTPPAPRSRLLALAGGGARGSKSSGEPGDPGDERRRPRPAPPAPPSSPRPAERPVPKPTEVFPPRRPAPPPPPGERRAG
ncbi:hypothetical protein NX801_29470 [Streptomyces sp. LP05-1]|uniref:Uncharacterized protein n=1 Tax=Streptomyces pyxinae TaxID=2970734 RepID=A0ABT2CSZ8_9ACTN|nr:hypothetical protein [Streptomyces sp. LP05-1]MCS0639694.1 hypothetical protein [Streptomyces sp. LP05-1]